MPRVAKPTDKISIVGDYFLAHPDVDLERSRISADTGLTEAEVTRCVYGLRKREHNRYPIVTVDTNVYRLEGAKMRVTLAEVKSAEPTMFELVGKTKGGKLLLRCERGDLYTAEPLDI